MEFAAEVIYLVLSSVNNNLIIYAFAISVGCEITYVGSTEMNNSPYINAKVIYTINFNDKETWILTLNICYRSEQMSHLKRLFL